MGTANKDHDLLITAVQKAGQALIKDIGIQGEASKISTFDYGVPQDLHAERIILDGIKALSLDCQIVTEESGSLGKASAEYKIYVDPLDGTVNYSRTIPCFCIGLAIYRGNEPVLGVVFDPNNNQLFVAEAGKGATMNGVPIPTPASPSNNPLINLEWFGASEFSELSSKLYNSGIRARTAGSGVLAFLYGAIGRGDGAILLENKPWDIAPGLVFANELGVSYTDINGQPLNLDQDKISVVAARDPLHGRLIDLIAA